METIEFNIVTLDWKKAGYDDFPESSGVYQVYGTSPLYGLETLLYIGQAKDLRSRIHQHFDFKEGVLGRQANKSCRYATVDKNILTAVEETLIIMHKPSFNSARLINVCAETCKEAIYIQNHGDRGMLNLETTNFYFLNHSEREIPVDVFPSADIK